ncbi:lateral signaling target protein 2 homolog [Culicoides brevitarsis]|uniref:lateral signaling target protein 2 homolog n=1 Tax=Culicoides brevitarsis TaxID=469753 RepID=UPI00307B919B
MDAIKRKIDGWLNKPKPNDQSLFARFYYADKNLTYVANELDSFDGRAEPERCSRLVGKLRQGQDKVLGIINQIMDELLEEESRACRAYRAKFPEEVLQESLAGQLWFGAECLAAGSSILNKELESSTMRPLAKAVSKSLDSIRNQLREQCLRNNSSSSSKINLDANESSTEILLESLKIFDRVFAEFEFLYVSAMVQVKTKEELETQDLICVLFSETLQRALSVGLLTQEQVDSYDPALMFSVPRLAILAGLLYYEDGPLNIEKSVNQMSEMFKPFRKLLIKLRELLLSLSKSDLHQLEILLCTNEQMPDDQLGMPQVQEQNFEYEFKDKSKTNNYYNETIFKLADFKTADMPNTADEDTESIVGFLVSNTNLGNLLNLDDELLCNTSQNCADTSDSGFNTGNTSVDHSPENESFYSMEKDEKNKSHSAGCENSDYVCSELKTPIQKGSQNPFTDTLIHRLFVCIAGVADQLQTNFAADLRRILRIVFTINVDSNNGIELKASDNQETFEAMSDDISIGLVNALNETDDYSLQHVPNDISFVNSSSSQLSHSQANQTDIPQQCNSNTQMNSHASRLQEQQQQPQSHESILQAPKWIADNDAPVCMNCALPFHSFFRRRHHCRNCGGVFCNICSSLCTPLPKYGLYKAVRVCKDCFTSESKSSK